MLGINCLLKNRSIQSSLRDIIEVAGYELASKTGEAKLKDVFRVLRQSELEIDIQTLSHLYEDIFDTTDPAFSDAEEIENARQETFKKLAEKTAQVYTSSIGLNKPSVAATANIINSLIKNITNKTQQKVMEERLIKAARRILGIKNKTTEKSAEDLIKEVLSTEQNNDYYEFGQMENAQTLFNEMADEMVSEGDAYDNAEMQRFGQILKGITLDFLASTGEIKKMVDATLKEAGYTKELNVNGETRQVVDWDKIIKSNVDFNAALKKLFTDKGISEENADNLVNGLANQYQDILSKKIEAKLARKNKDAKNNKEPEVKKNIDRLLDLYNLGIFENANQDALAKMMNVPDLKQEQLKQLRQIISSYQTMIHATPMAQWSPTVTRTFQRQIEALIYSFENEQTAVNVMSKLSSFFQWSNAIILVNPQNIVENLLSGFVEANVVTGAINPAGAWKGLSDFTNKFADFIKGGVRVGEEKANAFNRGGNLEDVYNRETKGLKRLDVWISAIPRAALSSADNGFKHQIVQSLIQKTLRQLLVSKGATKEEANLILNKIYYGNNDEIQQVAKQLSGSIVSAGVNTETTAQGEDLNVKEKVIASELALANMMTEGKFFQDTLNDMIASGELSEALRDNLDINEELLLTIRNAAYNTAAKGLGHEADNELLKMFETRYDALNKSIHEAQKKGDYGEYILKMTLKFLLAGINKFRTGGFNWMYLGLQKSTGLALAQTLITDVALGKTRGIPLKFSDIDFSDEDNAENQLSRYMALRQRLVRETIPVIFAYGISAAAIAFIKGGGDDEEKKKRLNRVKNYMDSHPAAKRWVNKLSPQLLYTYLSNVNGITMDKFPAITAEDAKKLTDNGIYDISSDNLPQVKQILGLSLSESKKLQEKIDEENGKELPSLVGAYINPKYQWEAQKNNIQPNPAIQWSINMLDRTKPDKSAITGQAFANILNLGGVLQSYDLWKNSITNPEKVEGEYKLTKPQGFGEGFMNRTLNKDLYKSLFVSENDLKLKTMDLPHIGKVAVEKLAKVGISEITEDNIGAVRSILDLKGNEIEDILNTIKFHKEKVSKIKDW